MKRRWSRPTHDERGASLVLAIVFMVVVGAIGGGMLASLASSQYNRNDFDLARNREYAADGAIEAAVAQMRARMTNGSTPYCVSSSQTLNSVPITVACTYTQTPTLSGFLQRNATFSAKCTSTQPPICPNTGVIIRAQVNFESTSPSTANPITVSHTFVQSWTVGP
jgi:Tfp pilus assembly protein PilX